MPACPRPGVYVPRQTHDCDAAVLVRQHLPSFLARLEESGHSLPEFVKRELEEFAWCGDFERLRRVASAESRNLVRRPGPADREPYHLASGSGRMAP